MVDRAVDLTKYRKRRETRQLLARVERLASDPKLQWRIDDKAVGFMRVERLTVIDLMHVIGSPVIVRIGMSADEIFVEGYTVDEAYVRICIFDGSKSSAPFVSCLGGKIIFNEEDLVG